VRKWIMWMDVILLFTCLALLLVDLQIKNDIVKQAKELEVILGGKGRDVTEEHGNIRHHVPGDILLHNGLGEPAVADENYSEGPVKRARSRKGRTAAAERGTGNGSSGIQPDGKPVGA
jgi:hypothetical protein